MLKKTLKILGIILKNVLIFIIGGAVGSLITIIFLMQVLIYKAAERVDGLGAIVVAILAFFFYLILAFLAGGILGIIFYYLFTFLYKKRKK